MTTMQINGKTIEMFFEKYDHVAVVDCDACNEAGCWYDVNVPDSFNVNGVSYEQCDSEWIDGDSDNGVQFWTYVPVTSDAEFSAVQVWNNN